MLSEHQEPQEQRLWAEHQKSPVHPPSPVHPLPSALAEFAGSLVVIKAAELERIQSVEKYLAGAARHAAEIQAQAELLAQRLRTDAQQAAQSAAHHIEHEARQRGYQDGLLQARAEQAETLRRMHAEQAGILLRAQTALARSWQLQDDKISFLVMRVLAKILAEPDAAPLFFASVAKRVLRAARQQKLLVFRVASEQLDIANTFIAGAVAELHAPPFIEVLADPDLPLGACLIETDHGEINASLDAQLAVLQAALAEVFGAGRHTADELLQAPLEER